MSLPEDLAGQGTDRGRRLARNFVALSVTQVIGRLLAFGVTVYLTRELGVEAFGLVAFALGVLAYAGLVVDLGFDSLGQREAARGRVPLERLVPTVVAMRLGLLALAAPLLTAFAYLAPLGALGRSVVLLYGVSLVTDAVHLRWVFLGTERPAWVGAAEAVEQALLLVGVLAAVRSPDDVLLVPLAFLAGRLASVAVLALGYRRHIGPLPLAPDPSLARPLVAQALPLGGSAAVGMLSHNFDLVLLGLWLGAEAAGLYGAAYRVVWVPTTFAMAYYAVLRPSIARGFVTGFDSIRELLDGSFRLTAAAGAGLVAWTVPLAGSVLGWLYGEAYAEAATALQFLVVATALVIVNRHYRAVLVAFEHQGSAFRVMAVGGLANVALNLSLIPLWGITGAAAATAVSEAVILLLGATATRARVAHLPVTSHLVRPAIAAVATVAVLVGPVPLPASARAVLGAIVYVTMLLVTRAVTVAEIAAGIGAALPGHTRGR